MRAERGIIPTPPLCQERQVNISDDFYIWHHRTCTDEQCLGQRTTAARPERIRSTNRKGAWNTPAAEGRHITHPIPRRRDRPRRSGGLRPLDGSSGHELLYEARDFVLAHYCCSALRLQRWLAAQGHSSADAWAGHRRILQQQVLRSAAQLRHLSVRPGARTDSYLYKGG